MDDYFVHDRGRPVLVASLDLRLDWLHGFGLVRLRSWTNRYNLPYPLCRGESSFLWYLGFILAHRQPSHHGHCLVRCAGKQPPTGQTVEKRAFITDHSSPTGFSGRPMCRFDDPSHLAQLEQHSQRHPGQFRSHHSAVRELLALLAGDTPRAMVPHLQDSTYLYGQGVLLTSLRHRLLCLGHCSRTRRWSDHSQAQHGYRQRSGVGVYQEHHELHRKLCGPDHQQP